MKKILLAITVSICLYACSFSNKLITKAPTGTINMKMVGTWEFKSLQDELGNKVDTIWHGMGWEIPKGPLIEFKEDGTYTKQFTAKNIDRGKWYFDSTEQTIVYILYYQKPYSLVAKDLIKRGHAKRDENGDYYEIIRSKVYEHTETEMTLIERKNRRRTFVKKSN